MSVEDRRKFIDTAWSVLADLKIDEFSELLEGKNVKAVFKNYAALDEDSRKLLSETMAKLRECAKGSLRELYAAARKKK